MKIVFVSNYFNHHQKPFCDAVYRSIGDDFVFISTSQMREERRKLGYASIEIPSFVKTSYSSDSDRRECQRLIDEADVVLSGSTPEDYLSYRKKTGKIILRNAERPLKNGNSLLKYLPRLLSLNRTMHGSFQYLLCSSAYAYSDYRKFGLFHNRAYKWGYFPEALKYDVQELVGSKNKREILWCGRFLPLKHPDDVVVMAKMLSEAGYDFELNFIGSGEMEEQLRTMIREYSLASKVRLLGAMKPEQVRQHMKGAGIYLFTSDFHEGWGAVANEAMNSGCAVVASHAPGSVPILICNGENGLIYKSGDVQALYQKVCRLLDQPMEQDRIGESAYHTIMELWNADVAAARFLTLAESILKNGSCDIFEDGPCSRADSLKNGWFHS